MKKSAYLAGVGAVLAVGLLFLLASASTAPSWVVPDASASPTTSASVEVPSEDPKEVEAKRVYANSPERAKAYESYFTAKAVIARAVQEGKFGPLNYMVLRDPNWQPGQPVPMWVRTNEYQVEGYDPTRPTVNLRVLVEADGTFDAVQSVSLRLSEKSAEVRIYDEIRMGRSQTPTGDLIDARLITAQESFVVCVEGCSGSTTQTVDDLKRVDSLVINEFDAQMIALFGAHWRR